MKGNSLGVDSWPPTILSSWLDFCDSMWYSIQFSLDSLIIPLIENNILLPDEWTGKWYFEEWLDRIELSMNAGHCVTLPLLKASTLIAETKKIVTRRVKATRWPDMMRLVSSLRQHCDRLCSAVRLFISSIMWLSTGGGQSSECNTHESSNLSKW